MKNHRWIETSRRAYARLLHLYPDEHRAEYGPDMLQVFSDQCRAIDQGKKKFAILVLWLRTLIDLGINIFREQITAPHAWQGLLEAVPGAPLPWKGAALVLIPGLIFFISQVAQLTGRDWFFLMSFRAAYFIIIPVLVVWAWKRRFPIWGLIPLGLLINTLLFVGDRLGYFRELFLAKFDSNHLLAWLVKIVEAFTPSVRQNTIAISLALAILSLLWFAWRRVGIPRYAWACLGAFVLLAVIRFLAVRQDFFLYNGPSGLSLGDQITLAYYDFYKYGGFLVMILVGALLAYRHGRLAVLLPLGYLLPTVIYGRVSNDWPSPGAPEFAFMLSVGAAALVYRFLVALAAPLWIVRSATGQTQKRASVVSLVILLAIQVGFYIYSMLYNGWKGEGWTVVYITADQLIVGAGVALALALYRAHPATGKAEGEAAPLSEATTTVET